ncbi:hypothetical protein Taro_041876 [Colocasia esculenta]|uniref:Uncharacterized protein n=1 Tax=Colocasia esculenta TaxID=4460 RepID=A0A843WMJ7_COLES|nr:hypothetical protein [Colocasia esculenta]
MDVRGTVSSYFLNGFGIRNACGIVVFRSRQTVRARRTFHDRRPVQNRAVAVQGRYLQLCSSSSSSVA